MSLAIRKAQAEFEASDALKDLNKQSQKVKDAFIAVLDADSVKKLEGTIEWTDGDTVAAPIAVFRWLSYSGRVLGTIREAIEEISKNSLGKEALAETFDKLVVKVAQDASKTGDYDYAWAVAKNGKELHITIGKDWSKTARDGNRCRPAETELVKLIENML